MPDAFQAAVEHHQAGRLREAEALYRQVLARQPRNNHALYLLSLIARQQGHNDAARDLAERAIAIAPSTSEYHLHLGLILMARQDYLRAADAFRTTLQLRPEFMEAHAHLGNTLYLAHDLAGAIDAFQSFLRSQPQAPEILNNLGTALREAGRLSEAVAAYRRAAAIQPNLIDVWQNLGHTLRQANDPRQAAAAYREALKLSPDSPATLYDLAVALKEAGELDAAIDAARRVLDLPPVPEGEGATRPPREVRHFQSLQLLGGLLHTTAQIDEVRVCHQRLLEDGRDARLAASLLHALYFNPQLDPPQIYADHVRWNELHARSLAPKGGVLRERTDPHRRLRIGYVSPDFRLHASSLFTLPLLSNHDRSVFEIICYADIARPDELTAAHRRCCDVWREITNLSDEQVAQTVRSDQIDLLVDLSLHAAGSRLLVFARKPAPIQLTWLAYPGTSGLETMDYRISDPYLDPPSTGSTRSPQAGSGQAPGLDEPCYSEKTICLPDCYWCYDPLEEGPPVTELPGLKNGFVTFGSMNRFAKVSRQTIDLWAKVLLAVAGSRMIVRAPPGKSHQRLLDQLNSHGVDSGRIEFVGEQARTPYMATFHRIDICLDTWPYPGHTTTLDALWMGVPVLTRPGATAVSRGGESILSNLGRREWVFQSPVPFVAGALALSGDLPALANLRRGLREQMRRSPLMDAPRFARNMESIYRTICQEWDRLHSAAKGL
ncbi:MAG TPA: tetratricopeptide repeat protein [Tepidisphaeraceae bacterium]|nr:tetratricopeptide repeat protein [Tepidisphaeraceae bacterium]